MLRIPLEIYDDLKNRRDIYLAQKKIKLAKRALEDKAEMLVISDQDNFQMQQAVEPGAS